MPTLSLCMIVRNNGRYVEHALRSIVPHVQEVVIVDTGSTDDTKEVIARVAPTARVLDFNAQTHPAFFLHDVAETWPGIEMPGPFTGKRMLGDFGAARQYGWQQATCEYLLWIDSDDVVEGGETLGEITADMAANGVDAGLLNYDYSTDSAGKVNLRLTRERIVRRTFGAGWMQPVHEVLVPMGVGRKYESVNIVHRRGNYGTTHDVELRNLKILMHWWSTHKDDQKIDARMLFYLGMETRFVWPDQAVAYFNRYCKESGWDEERSIAHIYCGTLHESAGRLAEAFAEYSQATAEFPESPDGLFGCARVAYFRQDWQKVIEFTERGLQVMATPRVRAQMLMWDPLAQNYRPHVFFAAALVNVGAYKRALESCEMGLKHAPNDPYLKGNKQVAENNLKAQAEQEQLREQPAPAEKPVAADRPQEQRPQAQIPLQLKRDFAFDAPAVDIPTDVAVAMMLQAIWRRALDESPSKALMLLDGLPQNMLPNAKVRAARDFTLGKLVPPVQLVACGLPMLPRTLMPPLTSQVQGADTISKPESVLPSRTKFDIVLWTGPAWEQWSPLSVDTTGIGGSETAAVCLMRELAARGHRVRVLSHCGDQAGTYNGVEYIHFDQIDNPSAFKCDVFIVSRQAQVLTRPIEAKARFLWVHDVGVGDPVAHAEALDRVDKIFCLSEWHRSAFAHGYGRYEKIVVTRNGIDVERFAKEPAKQGNRLIWTSSPDRGLSRLLDLLPQIRTHVPDVELHVYYGFHTWRSMVRNDVQQTDVIDHFEKRIREAPGVFMHGRVNQRELATAFSAAKVWASPTWFTETSCISAMEAQAAACVPVTTALAALIETVKHGILIPPPESTPEYAEAFVTNIVKMLTDEPARQAYATPGRAMAMQLGWDRVAASWETVFAEVLQQKNKPAPRAVQIEAYEGA